MRSRCVRRLGNGGDDDGDDVEEDEEQAKSLVSTRKRKNEQKKFEAEDPWDESNEMEMENTEACWNAPLLPHSALFSHSLFAFWSWLRKAAERY